MADTIPTKVLVAGLGLFGLGVVLGLAAGCGPAEATENRAPNLTLDVGSELEHVVGEGTMIVRMSATDPDGDSLSFRVANKPEKAQLQAFDQQAEFRWNPGNDDVTDGEPLRLTFIVEDEHGARADRVVHVHLKPGNGQPQFVTGRTHSHDIASKQPVQFDVEVDDDDSERVELTMPSDAAPKGATFEQTGPLTGEFTWEPSAKQKQSTSQTVQFRADDGDFDPVTRTVTIIFRDSGQQTDPDDPQTGGECDRKRPIGHTPVGTRRSDDDYQIEATFTADAADRYEFAAVLWTVDQHPDNDPDLEINSEELEIDGREISGSIPNLSLSSGESKTVFYVVCALDDEAPDDADDKVVCSSSVTYHSFHAYAPGSDQCVDDSKSIGSDSSAADISETEWSLFRTCSGEPDFHQFEVDAGQRVTAFFTYSRDRDVQFEVFDEAMEPLDDALAVSECAGIASVEIEHGEESAKSTYYVKVTGDEVPYQTKATVTGGSGACQEDDEEPNDTSSEATSAEGDPTLDGMSICPEGDVDVYAVKMLEGDVFGANVTFSQVDGDLDATLFAPSQSGEVGPSADGVAQSWGTESPERIAATTAESGTYYLAVFSKDRPNDYSIDFDTTCRDNDEFAPNHSLDEAALPSEGTFENAKQCAGQADWFEFTVFSDQDLSATIDPKTGASASEFSVEAYDSGGNRIQEGVEVDGKRLVDFTAPEKAQYFIKVESAEDFFYDVSFERRN